MWRKLVNWINGYLTIKIKGNSPERFINLCFNKKIFIWNLKNIDGDYIFLIKARDYKRLKPIAKKTKMVPGIMIKAGLPFHIHKYRKRKLFFAGVFLCGLLVYIMSLFIWNIQILGGYKYTPEAMIKFLDEYEIFTGIKKSKVDCQKIEEDIRLAYKDIGWVSAEIKGTRLIIKITETSMPAPAIKTLSPSHIVATKDLIVEKIVTRSGVPLVKPGDVVKKGDILVSGIVPVMSDFGDVLRNKPVVADATILCKSYYDYSEVLSMNYYKKNFTGEEKKGFYLSYLENKLFLYNPRYSYDTYDIIVDENILHITDSYYLPFRYGTTRVREYTLEKTSYSPEEAKEIANNKLNRYFKLLTDNGVSILEHNIVISIGNNKCKTEGRIIVLEAAWEYKKVQDSEWRIEQVDEHN